MPTTSRLNGDLIALPWRVRDRRCLDAAVAAAVLVAAADGPVGAGKRRLLERMLQDVDEFRAFDVRQAVQSIDQLGRLIRARGGRGRAQVVDVVAQIAGEAENARLVLRVAVAMARADGPPSRAACAQVEAIAAAAGAPAPDLGALTPKVWDAGAPRPQVITLASAKGGTGKSTTAIHLAVALLRLGHQVGVVDLDGAQGTLSRYIANRVAFAEESGTALGLPRHRRIEPSQQISRDLAEAEEAARVAETLAGLADCRYVVMDTPGHDCHLARLGCAQADTLVTPLNDSLIDVGIIARIDRKRREVLGPSEHSRWIWEENDRRVAAGRWPLDWIVMRNRLAHVEARNNREISALLRQLAPRLGFQLVRGLSERVVFRELFLQGLTVLDAPAEAAANPSLEHARREIEDLLRALGAAAEDGPQRFASLAGAPAPADAGRIPG